MSLLAYFQRTVLVAPFLLFYCVKNAAKLSCLFDVLARELFYFPVLIPANRRFIGYCQGITKINCSSTNELWEFAIN